MARRRPLLKFTIAVFAAAGVVCLAAPMWLPLLGRGLVRDEGPAKADLAVVLGGDFFGDRILKAGDLVRQGYVPAALVSGPEGFLGQHECDFTIRFAVRHGYPEKWFIPYPADVHSTQDEATAILPELRRRHIHSVLVITSNYHTARAARVFRSTERSLGGGIQMRMVSVPDRSFRPDSWWRSREGQKVAFLEWLKTVTGIFGI